MKKKEKKRLSRKHVRTVTALVFIALVVVGLATNLAPGMFCTFGIGDLAALCPLGALEVMLASRTIVPAGVISLACLIVLAVLLGRVFCGWVCPVTLIRPKKRTAHAHPEPDPSTAQGEEPSTCPAAPSPRGTDEPGEPCTPSRFHHSGFSRFTFDSRHVVLLGALVSSAVAGFPVFCLVCPVGLTFGLIVGLVRLVGFNEPSWLLVYAIVMIVLELAVLPKWCHKLCPLGALMSLFAGLNKTLRPRVDESKCLRTTKGIDCTQCRDACYENINLHDAQHSRSLAECTKCGACADGCPAQAISFRLKGMAKPGGLEADNVEQAGK